MRRGDLEAVTLELSSGEASAAASNTAHYDRGLSSADDAGCAVGRNRHDLADPGNCRFKLHGSHRAVCDIDVFLRGLVHHGADVSDRPVRWKRGSDR